MLESCRAFAFNIRVDKFKDPRLRRAFNFAFNFEEINYEIFYGEYKRIKSYFEGTELACSGIPQGRELELLTPLKSELPPEVFTTPYWNPVARTETEARRNLLEAMRLLELAGFVVRDLRLVNVRTGEPLTVEFLLSDPSAERFVLSYKASLERLGIQVAVRVVDAILAFRPFEQFFFEITIRNNGKKRPQHVAFLPVGSTGSRASTTIAHSPTSQRTDGASF